MGGETLKKFVQAVFRTVPGQIIFWVIVSIMLPAILEELFALNDMLSIPFKHLAEWKADSTLEGRLKFILLFIVYASPIAVIAGFLASRRKSGEIEVQPYRSRNNYERLIADVKETVNSREATNQLKAEKINLLFDGLIEDVCHLFQVQRSGVRAVLVINNRGRHKLTSWRWGRACTPDQDRMDYKAIDKFLETELTYPTWEQVKSHFDHTDSDTLLFIRNSGKLGLGWLIAIENSIDLEKHMQEWEHIVSPFTMLGHMDKLVRFVVNYT
jgi:hypothetical protein